jgi:acyl carrier protein
MQKMSELADQNPRSAIESRVKKVIANLREVNASSIDITGQLVPDLDVPRLVSRLSEEFGTGVFRGLLPQTIQSINDLVDAILPAMEAGPRYCTCSLDCGFQGSGTNGDPCPQCGKGSLVCKIL